MKKSARYIFLLFAIYSCKTKTAEDAPEDLLPEKKMVEVMVDLTISEAMIGNQYLPGDTIRSGAKEFYDELLKRHEITKEQLQHNILYYSFKTDRFTAIMEQAVDSLNVLSAELDKK